jgi:hypothetical protein
VANLFTGQGRDHTHRTRRGIGRAGAVAVAIVAAASASFVTAFANHIVSTTPTPTRGLVGTTALTDTAIVYADSSRHIAFALWAPNTCGTTGATPVFTDTEPVLTSALANSTVNSASYVPKQTGVFEWTAEVIVNSDNSVENGPTACTDEQVAVAQTPTAVNTTPSDKDGGPVGTWITDTATVTGGVNPTGTVTFFLYAPSNKNCVSGEDNGQTWLQRWIEPLSGNGTASVPAPGHKTTTVGTYNWVAVYSGDSNNLGSTSACGTEAVTFDKAAPTISTVASNGGPVGTQIHDTAQLSGGVNPTGTVTFTLFPPSNPTCSTGEGSTGAVQTVTVPLGTDGSASSAGTPYTTTEVGVYNWVATYSGDANNLSATTSCSAEQVTIGKDPTTVATVASPGGKAGTAIHDTAKVTGIFLPTGTVTFTLYGPTDKTCTAAPIFTSTETLNGSGSATSGTFSATSATGTYNWIATYSGDARSAGSKSKCGAEPVSITASGVKGITTPGTGEFGALGQGELGLELLLIGFALYLGSALLRDTRKQ